MAGTACGTQAKSARNLDARLNSVNSVLAALEHKVAPIAPLRVASRQAFGAICAGDVSAPRAIPSRNEALIDGRAAASAELIGASPMSPVFVMQEPIRVGVGDALPCGCDCVIEDALVVGEGAPFEIHGTAAPGDGVRRAGEDFRAGEPILRMGERVSPSHVLALAVARIDEIEVRRLHVRVVTACAEPGAADTTRLIANLAEELGALVEVDFAQSRRCAAIAKALSGDWDAALIVGGTGSSGYVQSVDAVCMSGELVARGLALDPGRTGAAGLIDGKPVVCIPGRFDSALSVFLAVAFPLMLRLSCAKAPPRAWEAPLARKIASTVGLTQIVLLQFLDGAWMPLVVGEMTLSTLLRADAYLLVPEGSEGFAEGAVVTPVPLPGRSSNA